MYLDALRKSYPKIDMEFTVDAVGNINRTVPSK